MHLIRIFKTVLFYGKAQFALALRLLHFNSSTYIRWQKSMLVNKWVLQALQLIFTCVEKSAFISDLSHISRVKIACRVKKKKGRQHRWHSEADTNTQMRKISCMYKCQHLHISTARTHLGLTGTVLRHCKYRNFNLRDHVQQNWTLNLCMTRTKSPSNLFVAQSTPNVFMTPVDWICHN